MGLASKQRSDERRLASFASVVFLPNWPFGET
jgi:hypothetical protein